MGARRGSLGSVVEAYERSRPRPRVLVLSFPHNPTTATVEAAFMQRVVDLARERELVVVHDFAYADIAFDGHVPPSILQADRRGRGRRRAVLADEGVLDGRLAGRLRARERRGRAGARPAEVVPRLRNLPGEPDRLDRGDERGARLPPEVCEIYRSRRDALYDGLDADRLADARPQGHDVRLGADPGAVPRSARSSSRSSSPARPGRGQPGHRLGPAATGTSASRSSRTSSGSARRSPGSAGRSRARG